MIKWLGWTKDDRGAYSYAFKTKNGHKHVINVAEIQGKWQFVWVRGSGLTLAERSGFDMLELCMTALWEAIFEAQDERINLSVERAKRIIAGGSPQVSATRRVVVEAPFAADTQEQVERNLRYLRVCMHDCIARGEAPFASHGLYTQPGVLDDRDRDQRKLGIEAGLAWKDVAHATVVYTDLGISSGMTYGVQAAARIGQCVEYRSFGPNWEALTGDLSTELWGR